MFICLGADITDYFNYGFNEDTWTKYCEKQRRLRIENNSHKSGNLIFVSVGNLSFSVCFIFAFFKILITYLRELCCPTVAI